MTKPPRSRLRLAEIEAPLDPRLGSTVDRRRFIGGRDAHPTASRELVVSSLGARRFHLHAGSRIAIRFGTPAELAALFNNALKYDPSQADPLRSGEGPLVDFTVTGVFQDFSDAENQPVLLTTQAFLREYGANVASAAILSELRLRRRERDLGSFELAVKRLSHGAPISNITPQDLDEALGRCSCGRACLPGGGARRRHGVVAAALPDHCSRALLGGRRGRDTAGSWVLAAGAPSDTVLQVAAVVLVVAVVALASVTLTSPLLPRGAARAATTSLAGSLDPLTSIVAIVGVVVAAALAVARAGHRSHYRNDLWRGSVFALRLRGPRALSLLMGRPALRIGSGFVFERGAVAGWSIQATGFGILAVLGAPRVLTFAAGLDRLINTPRLYGSTFDARARLAGSRGVRWRGLPLILRSPPRCS